MTRVALHHVTTYRYDRPASLGPQLVRLRPAPHGRPAIERYALTIAPTDHDLQWQQDAFANWVARVIVPGLTEELRVEVALEADLQPFNPFAFFIEPYAADAPFDYPPDLRADLAPFLATEPHGVRFDALAARFEGRQGNSVQLLVDLNTAVRGQVGYRQRMEAGTQTPEETLTLASGSCRDSGWLLVQLMRRLGFAARFVSGYSIQLADGADIAADIVDLHAWAEAYLPGAGWIGFDPTSGLLTGEGHIPLAATPRLASAAPIEGKVFGEARADFDFTVDVRRLGEAVRP